MTTVTKRCGRTRARACRGGATRRAGRTRSTYVPGASARRKRPRSSVVMLATQRWSAARRTTTTTGLGAVPQRSRSRMIGQRSPSRTMPRTPESGGRAALAKPAADAAAQTSVAASIPTHDTTAMMDPSGGRRHLPIRRHTSNASRHRGSVRHDRLARRAGVWPNQVLATASRHMQRCRPSRCSRLPSGESITFWSATQRGVGAVVSQR